MGSLGNEERASGVVQVSKGWEVGAGEREN